jgi:5-methylcytosine-specific restriction endonuclease McrA
VSKAWEGGSTTRWRTFRAHLLGQWALQGRDECEIRGSKCTTRATHVDHIVTLAMGGEQYDPLNCRPACEPCNTGRRVVVEVEPPPVKVSRW